MEAAEAEETRRVYPRACGGTHSLFIWDWRTEGLSPRLRGNRRPTTDISNIDGSIPAPAGEPTTNAVSATVA